MPVEKIRCKHCNSRFVFRTRARPLERTLVNLLRLTPFGCHACDRRFYARIENAATIQQPEVRVEIEGSMGPLSAQ
jgi:hypothetical protein